MKAQPQRRRRIMQMERTKQQWKARHHFRVSRQLETLRHTEWRTHPTVPGARHVRGQGRNADHKRSATSSRNRRTVNAFFGEHDPTAKLVLILREHKCSRIGALPILNKGGQDVWVAKSVADLVRRTGLQRLPWRCPICRRPWWHNRSTARNKKNQHDSLIGKHFGRRRRGCGEIEIPYSEGFTRDVHDCRTGGVGRL